MTAAAVVTLNQAAQVALVACEQRIERGLKTFIDVGQALAEIRDSRLYKGTHGTFEEYCRDRWKMSDGRARQFMIAASTVTNVAVEGLPAPTNEGQARALAAVPEPERVDVWRETVERTNGKPTAAAVRAVQSERTQTPGPAGAVTAPPADPGATPEPAPAGPPPASVEAFERAKRAAEQRDARGLLFRIVELLAPASRTTGFINVWVDHLGPLDTELLDLRNRAISARAVLDNLIEGLDR